MEQDFYSYYVEEDADEIVYCFTNAEAQFAVSFSFNQYVNHIEEYPTLLQNSFGLGIHQFPFHIGGKCKQDPLVKKTIDRIITGFLSEHDDTSVLLYHCDYLDGKQQLRSRKFSYWYATSFSQEDILKQELTIEAPSQMTEIPVNHYIGFLCLHKNPNLENIKKEFEQFSYNLSVGDNK